jgi:hypothetical protein
MLKGIRKSKEKVIGIRENPHNEEVYTLYSFLNIIRTIKSELDEYGMQHARELEKTVTCIGVTYNRT